MDHGLIFDVRTDTNDNGGGKVREYRCPARHRLVPYTSIRKSLSSAGKRAALGHVRPHDLRHTFVTRLLDLAVPIEQVNYLAGHKSMAMTKRGFGARIAYRRVTPLFPALSNSPRPYRPRVCPDESFD